MGSKGESRVSQLSTYLVLSLGSPSTSRALSDSNVRGARELLQEYWNKIGGEPGAKGGKKRGRKSITKSEADGADTSDTTEVAKKQKTSTTSTRGRPGRKKKEEVEVEDDDDPVIADKWNPPPVTPGAWENDVLSIETIEGIGEEKFAYLIWAAKDEKGSWHTSKAKLSTVYIACPQRVRLPSGYTIAKANSTVHRC